MFSNILSSVIYLVVIVTQHLLWLSLINYSPKGKFHSNAGVIAASSGVTMRMQDNHGPGEMSSGFCCIVTDSPQSRARSAK